MYDEDELLPISALQHLAFCERQWGLMFLENVWDDNVLTVKGRNLHERVDESGTEVRGKLRIARGLILRSLRLGLIGRADVVEFHLLYENQIHDKEDSPDLNGVCLPGVPGLWRPFLVEYKRGKPKANRCDEIQLCAQALCLEEMLNTEVKSGALFYGQPWKRYPVTMDHHLRSETERLASRLHELSETRITPHARYEKKCRSCSLVNYCLPKLADKRRSAQKFLQLAVSKIENESEVE